MTNPLPQRSEKKVLPFPYPITATRKLKSPKNLPSVDFFKTIKERRSIRIFKKIKEEDLSNLLWASSKIQSINLQDNGYVLTQRPTPSAGARHPIDLVISCPTMASNETLFYYNPIEHSLNELDLNKRISESLYKHGQEVLPAGSEVTMVWLVTHKNRTNAKYRNADSLVWRDAGAVLYCIQIVCSALGLNSCQIGTLGNPYIKELFKELGMVSGGGCIFIGNDK